MTTTKFQSLKRDLAIGSLSTAWGIQTMDAFQSPKRDLAVGSGVKLRRRLSIIQFQSPKRDLAVGSTGLQPLSGKLACFSPLKGI